jgi:hypothetical protein
VTRSGSVRVDQWSVVPVAEVNPATGWRIFLQISYLLSG